MEIKIKKIMILMMAIIMLSVSSFAFSGGTGTNADPYIVNTCAELQSINTATTSFYNLGQDINCSGFNYNSFSFTGTLDGKGHKIIGLSNPLINTLSGTGVLKNFVLMNGTVSGYNDYNAPVVMRNSAIIDNVGVENYVVYGRSQIGGFVGRVDNGNSQVTNSYTKNTQIISKNDGTSDYVGGFVGYNLDGHFTSCSVDTNYSIYGNNQIGGFVGGNLGYIYDSIVKTGNVNGNNYVGGFIGYNDGYNHNARIYRSFAINYVTGGSNIGGFVGYFRSNGYGSTTETYYNKDITPNGGNAIGLTTSQLKSIDLFDGYSSFDFKNVWSLNSSINNGYPFLRSIFKNYNDSLDYTMLGDGTSGNPYQINSCKQLYNIRNDNTMLNKNYILTQNIDCSNIEFDPIGDSSHKFIGIFNGNNFNISNTRFALFDYIGSGATVKNINILNAKLDVVSVNVDGILSRYNAGTIENVFTNGLITSSQDYIGGLVGQQLSGGIIRNSKSYADVVTNTGTSDNIGGLVGYTQENSYIYESVSFNNNVIGHNQIGGFVGDNLGYIYDSYSQTPNINGYQYVGGFVGYNDGTNHNAKIYTSYSVGHPTAVSGNNVNGFVGYFRSNGYGLISDCRYDSISSGLTNKYKATPLTTGKLNDIRYLSGDSGSWDFNNIWYFNNVTGYPQLQKIDNVNKTIPQMLGDGTSGNPYQITTCNQIYLIPEGSNSYYSLMNNVDCSKSMMKRKNFYGNFNGNNNEISYTYTPLFENIKSGGNVHNLGVVNFNNVGNTFDYYGVITRYVDGGGIVNKVWTSGTIQATNNYIGGISGRISGGTIENSKSYVNIIGTSNTDNIGGITGYLDGNGYIYTSSSYGDINGRNQIGGVVGYLHQGYVYDTFSLSNSITGNANIGGIVGYLYGSSSSYRTYAYRGYWDGTTLTGNSYVGGGIGRDTGSYAYENSLYWNQEKSGITTSSGGNAIGLTNAQMIVQSSFAGFDFNTNWFMDTNLNNYPNLQGTIPLVITDFNTYINYPTNNEVINLNNSMDSITFQYLHDSNSSDVTCKLYIDGIMYDSRNNVGQSIQSFTLNRWKSKNYLLDVVCSDGIVEKKIESTFTVNVAQDLLTGNPNNNDGGGVTNANINISEILDAINSLNLTVVTTQGQTIVNNNGTTEIYHTYTSSSGQYLTDAGIKNPNSTLIFNPITNTTEDYSNKTIIDVTGLYNTLMLKNGTTFENIKPSHFYKNVLDKPYLDSNKFGIENGFLKWIADNFKTWMMTMLVFGLVTWGLFNMSFAKKKDGKWVKFRNKTLIVTIISLIILFVINVIFKFIL